MVANLYWFSFFLIIYISFCLFWGARTLRKNKTPEAYYLADRSVSPWVFFFSATVATFAGITLISFPALVYADGYSFLATAAIVITIPLGSILFLRDNGCSVENLILLPPERCTTNITKAIH